MDLKFSQKYLAGTLVFVLVASMASPTFAFPAKDIPMVEGTLSLNIVSLEIVGSASIVVGLIVIAGFIIVAIILSEIFHVRVRKITN